jgi:hypothetical protein
MIEVKGFNPRPPRPIEPCRIAPIRDDDGDRRLEATVADGVDQRLQIAAAPRDQDAEAPVHVRLV